MEKCLVLAFGIIGIALTLVGTVIMFNKLTIDLSALFKIEEEKLKEYDGRDAYLNLRQQVIDAIKHTNKVNDGDYVSSKGGLVLIVIGSIFQAISLIASI